MSKNGGAIIELRGVSKQFPGRPRPVLDNLDMAIFPNERLVIHGVSGVGKTTLLNILALLLIPDGGDMFVEGQPTRGWNESARAKWRNSHVGFVFQKFCLIPELTVEENVSIPNWIRGRTDKVVINNLIKRVGLSGRERDYPHQLSGGEEQRVAIARALSNQPNLVFADEPTGNLDEESSEQVGRLLLEMQKELGFTLVVASHDRHFAQVLQANVLWMESGKVHKMKYGEDLPWANGD